jgi:hypothetical protein
MSERPDPRSAPWPHYASAVVEMILDGRHVVLTPLATPDRIDDPTEPAPAGRGSDPVPSPRPLPASWGPPIWILTAGDPYPVELTAEENAGREQVLIAELDAAGISHGPALGRSPDGSTSEISRALRGIDRVQALVIAERHGQLAVYEIDDRIRCIDVASAEVITSRAFTIAEVPAGSDALGGSTGWRG